MDGPHKCAYKCYTSSPVKPSAELISNGKKEVIDDYLLFTAIGQPSVQYLHKSSCIKMQIPAEPAQVELHGTAVRICSGDE